MQQGQSTDAGLIWLQERARQVDAKRARRENFPVASRLLAPTMRRDLLACYAVARLIDDAGDEAPGDRLAILDAIDDDLVRVGDGQPQLAPIRALLEPVRERGLPVGPFRDLVAAGRMDQQVSTYADLEALRGYCRLSAEPVGRLVLALWSLSDEVRVALSDEVCTGLQITEHLQDVGEDLRAGRVYLPQDTLGCHGVTDDVLWSLLNGSASSTGRVQVAAALSSIAGQARRLIDDGSGLVALLRGTPRVAVAGFVAGGLAALDAVGRAGADAVTSTPRPRRRSVVWRTTQQLARASLRRDRA